MENIKPIDEESESFEDKSELEIYKLLQNLDEEQRRAVQCTNKNTICKAVAGSGKTRVLTHRVAYLIQTGVPQRKILLLTFTNKASKEMTKRVKDLLNVDVLHILGGTFHHVAVVLLRQFANELGYSKYFSIATPDDAQDLIKPLREDYVKKFGISKKEFPTAKIIYYLYSSSMNLRKSIEDISIEENRRYSYEVITGINYIIDSYKEKKKQANAMDFDDLLINLNEILKIERIRELISSRYEYVLVDEYQDINWVQNEIIERLNRDNNNLFVAGDSQQAIYSWRGSKVTFIEEFEKYHNRCNVFPISHNYRSDGEILKLAENAISNNFWDKSKAPKIIPYLPYENIPTLFKANDDNEQSEYIVREIKEKLSQGIAPNEIAILVRANYLTKMLEKAFRQNDIPYKLLAGYSFFEREQVRDILCFLRFVDNPKDEFAFSRMANLFEGVGAKTISNLFEHFKSNDYDVNSLTIDGLKGNVRLSKNAKEGISTLNEIFAEIFKDKDDIRGMIKAVVDIYYDSYLKSKKEDYVDRMKDVDYLIDSANSYNSLSEFLSDMVLDVDDKKEEDIKEENRVIITTVHKAKGLEWDCVFIPYLNEGIFPGNKSEDEESIREERRLFYVAITRAKKHLFMSNISFQLQTYKYYESSRFLAEVDEDLYKRVKYMMHY